MAHPLAINEETFTGKYVGAFEGVKVFETKRLGSITTPKPDGWFHYRAATVPGRGIIVGEGVFTSGKKEGLAMMQHEYGHILQFRKFGPLVYWLIIAPSSLFNATFFPSCHYMFWTETWANYLAKAYFGDLWIGGNDYPTRDINMPF